MPDNTFTAAVRRYLSETLGIQADLQPWPAANRLPFALQEAYHFFVLSLVGHEFLLVAARDAAKLTPATIAKQLGVIAAKSEHRTVFGADHLLAYNRKRLVEYKVPFIVPASQLYLPDVGIDFREYIPQRSAKKDSLSPAAQVVLLMHLLGNGVENGATATGLAQQLQYSKMTMSRAIDELQSLALVEVVAEGREKHIRFCDGRRQLWKMALPCMSSPVQKRVFVKSIDRGVGLLAGLSALAEQSMLVGPECPSRALSTTQWKKLRENGGVEKLPKQARDVAALELEVWRYDPAVLSDSQRVDPLSLYLSLQAELDVRVEAALEQLIEDRTW